MSSLSWKYSGRSGIDVEVGTNKLLHLPGGRNLQCFGFNKRTLLEEVAGLLTNAKRFPQGTSPRAKRC